MRKASERERTEEEGERETKRNETKATSRALFPFPVAILDSTVVQRRSHQFFAMPAAALSLRRLSGPSLAPARRTSRTSATPVVVTRALFGGKNRQGQNTQEAVEQLPPAPVRRSSSGFGRNNARRSSPQQLVAAPGSGSSHAPSLSQRYESSPPLARGMIGAAAALALFAVAKKIFGGGR